MSSRRHFLHRALWTGAAWACAPLAACAQSAPPIAWPVTHPRPLGRTSTGLVERRIPSSGQPVPAIGLGTSGSYEVAADSPAYAALREAMHVFFDGGGSVIDTAPNYGNAETIVGALLAEGGWRSRCFLATKLAADNREALEAQWAASRQRLRTASVELLQVHNLRNLGQALPYARELKARGECRYVGLTHYREAAHAELARLMRAQRPDFVQVNYSVAEPRAAATVFPVARELGIAVIVNRAFDDGRLFERAHSLALPAWAAEMGIASWAQAFLRFTLSDPAVTVVIPATGKPSRQADNLKGGIGALLDSRQQAELVRMFR